jgi:single-stranded-DNA-specific exonuclease
MSEPDQDKLSVRGRQWVLNQPDERASRALQSQGLPGPMADILSARGITTREIDDYLDPKLRNLMPDPSRFKDMVEAAEHVSQAMMDGKRIGIWSDYDCDGATSGAILARFLRIVGYGEVPLRIPDRITEGYGPNAKGLVEMKEQGVDTVCILDAGIVAFEPLKAAKDVGLDVVVIDHHAAEDEIPEAVAVVNANRKDEPEGYGHLCAAGMTFNACVAMARALRTKGWFTGKNGRPDQIPDLMQLLDLVALGTVCDVVPLTTLNRAFVASGLKIMSKRGNAGIVALATTAGIGPRDDFTAADCGWKLGPRINAGGRISDSTLGARLLIEDDPVKAKDLAEELEECNARRKQMEEDSTTQALEQFEDRVAGADRKIAIAVVKAHEGVVGISASRLKDRLDCPSIVLTEDHEGMLKGSARSVKGFDIGHGIIDARKAGLIVKGGGHGMAGGLTLTKEQMPAFETFMNDEISKSDYARDGIVTEVDTEITPDEFSTDLIDAFERMEPCGTENQTPRVVLKGAIVKGVRVLKEKHLKLTVGSPNGDIDCLMWGVNNTDISVFIEDNVGVALDLYGEAQINEFRGQRKPQMIVDDLRLAEGKLI